MVIREEKENRTALWQLLEGIAGGQLSMLYLCMYSRSQLGCILSSHGQSTDSRNLKD